MPSTPGEILRKNYLKLLGTSAHAPSVALGVPATRIHEIVSERRGVSADTTERSARYFGGDAASWLNPHATYDLKTPPTRDEVMRWVEPRATQTLETSGHTHSDSTGEGLLDGWQRLLVRHLQEQQEGQWLKPAADSDPG